MDNSVPAAFDRIGYTLGIQLVFWITILCLVVALIGFFYGAVRDSEFGFGVFIAAGFGWICMLVALVVMLWPFDGRFWANYRVEGHVTNVSNVITEASGDLTRQPVVTLEGLERPVVIDDPRAVSLEDADVILRCRIQWNYQAADSYSCRIIDFASGVAK